MRERQTIAVTSIGFVALLLAAFTVDAIDSRRAAMADSERDLRNTASLVAEQTRQLFETADLALRAVILAHHEWQADPARSPASGYRLVQAIQKTSSMLEGLGWTNAAGDRTVSSLFEAPPPLNVADQPHFTVHTANPGNGLYIGAPIVSRLSGTWISLVSRRINGPGGEFVGVAQAILNASHLSAVLERYHISENVNVSIYLRSGDFLAHFPDSASRLGQNNADSPLFREHLPKSDAGAFRAFAFGSRDERLYGYRAVTGFPLVVAVSTSEAEVLAPWFDRIRITGIVTLLAVVGGIAAALRLWRQAGRLRVEHEAARRAQLAAEQASRSKSEFLAQMSHELRTPMNAVLGFTEMMTKEIFGPVGSPRYREYLRDIEASGQHLLQVINNILDLAKVEAGKWEMDEAVVEIGELARSTALLLRERARAAGIALSIGESAPAMALRGDSRLLRQIVLNLLTNAIKFSDRGGNVRLRWRRAADGRAIIEVSDEGIGMTPEEIRRALQPYGSNSTRAGRRQDTGLGLSLCKHFAELHGGSIVIASEIGKGTSVAVFFPVGRVVDRTDAVVGAAAA